MTTAFATHRNPAATYVRPQPRTPVGHALRGLGVLFIFVICPPLALAVLLWVNRRHFLGFLGALFLILCVGLFGLAISAKYFGYVPWN